MGQALLIDCERQSINQRFIEKNPETALRILIAQQTNGQPAADFLHSVVRTVIPRNDNGLKRLLYYYLESIGDDRRLVVCLNQIAKDLESPNEYVRGLVLNYIARLNTLDYVSSLLKGVRQNLSNKSAFVRMSAVACLTVVSEKFEVDIEDELRALAGQESSPLVLKVLFEAMVRLGIPVDEYLNTEYPLEVLDTLVLLTDDLPFLAACLNMRSDTTVFRAACRILEIRYSGARINEHLLYIDAESTHSAAEKEVLPAGDLEKCIDAVLRILGGDAAYRHDFTRFVPFVEGRALDLLRLLDPYEEEFSKAVVSQSFQTADTHEFVQLAEMLSAAYHEEGALSEVKSRFRVFLLGSMERLVQTHCVYAREMVGVCLGNLEGDVVESSYASLRFLMAVLRSERDENIRGMIVTHLINAFGMEKRGRILRLMFDAMAAGITEKLFDVLLDRLFEGIEQRADCFSRCEVFIGTHIALFIAECFNPGWKSRARAIALLIRLLQFGGSEGSIDISARSTISLCIRAILKERKEQAEPTNSRASISSFNDHTGIIDTLVPITFPILGLVSRSPPFEWVAPNEGIPTTIQLSGLGDPLYIEANLSYTRHEIALDILVINQTEAYLQDINFDFITSKYLKQCSKLTPLSLQANTAATIQARFAVVESATCFISAAISFKFPRNQEYASAFVQNIDEISISIGNFLEGASVDFKQLWKTLEWENIYSLTITTKDIPTILQSIVKATNAHVCDRFQAQKFLIANIACYTCKKALVLVNLCFSIDATTAAEVRIRSEDEEVVKNISSIISGCLKASIK